MNIITSIWFLFDRTRVEPYLFPPWTLNPRMVFPLFPPWTLNPRMVFTLFAPFQDGFLLNTGWTFITFPCVGLKVLGHQGEGLKGHLTRPKLRPHQAHLGLLKMLSQCFGATSVPYYKRHCVNKHTHTYTHTYTHIHTHRIHCQSCELKELDSDTSYLMRTGRWWGRWGLSQTTHVGVLTATIIQYSIGQLVKEWEGRGGRAADLP